MATLKTNLIEPEGATTTLIVGEAGGDLVIGADSLKANLIKAKETITIFTTVESTTWTAPTGTTSVEYLVVGGGGGGGGAGSAESGGGGAGQFQTGTLTVTPASNYTVTVGAGGTGAANNTVRGSTGASSVFSSVTSTGGGGGGTQGSGIIIGGTGASGGGGAFEGGTGGAATSATTGYDGGDESGTYAGGGGGGSGGVGQDGSARGNGYGGNGGIGTSSSITGTATLYAGGGGGSAYTNGPAGPGGEGRAGGGRGGSVLGSGVSPGGAAQANTGSGGGAGSSYTGSFATGAAGGSGIVVLKYAQPTGGNTLFSSNGSGTVSSVNAGWGGVQVLLSTQNISNAAAASITSGFTSTYQEYIIEWIGLQPVTDGTWFQWQASTDGGSNYNTTCTSTCFTAQHNEDGSGGALNYNSGQDANISTGYIYTSGSYGNASDECGTMTIHLFNPADTTLIKNWYLEDQHYQGDNWSMNIFTGGSFNTASAVNAVNFKFVSGNINAGTLKLYGIK